jgi:hypothetical protein
MSEETSSIKELKLVISSLQEAIASLQRDMSRLSHPLKNVFLAKEGGDSGGWTEHTVDNGAIVEFIDGRTSDEALIEADDVIGVMEVEDIVDGVKKKSYVPIGGPGGTKIYRLQATGDTYDVFELSDSGMTTPVAEGKTPIGGRPFLVDIVDHAHFGIGKIIDGDFRLLEAFGETFDTYECPA